MTRDTPMRLQDDDLEAFRRSVAKWVDASVVPHVETWEHAGRIPRHVYSEAAELGVLAPGFPSEYGGLGNAKNDLRALMAVCSELSKAASGGFIASLLTHNISLPPILASGNRNIIEKVVPRVLAGHAVCSLAITEPGGGSDVAAITTHARREGDEWILNGQKTYITSGMQADFLT